MGPGMKISAGPNEKIDAAMTPAHMVLPVAEPRGRTVLLELNRSRVSCTTCTLQDLCLGEGLDAEALAHIDDLVTARIRLHKGDTLFRAGDRFTSLYAIRSGSCKTISLTEDGHDQVAGYHM